jgi:hypothetical protein
MGAAGWHLPVENGWNSNMWLTDCPGVTANEEWKSLLWKSGDDHTDEDTKRIWEGVDLEKWMETWCGIEHVRRVEMGDQPHW